LTHPQAVVFYPVRMQKEGTQGTLSLES
jgi:hypothetical protein